MKLTLIITGAQILNSPVTSVSKNLRSCDGHVFNKSQIAAVLSEQGVTVVDLTYTESFDIQSVAEGDGGIYNVVLADGTTAIFQSTANVKVVVSDEAASEEAGEPAAEETPAPAPRGRAAAAAPAQRGRAAAPAATADDLEGFDELGDEGGDLGGDDYNPEEDPDFAEEAPTPAPRGRAAAAPARRGAAPAPQLEDEGFDEFGDEPEAAPAPAPRGRAAAAPVAPARRPAAAAPVAPARRPAAAAPAAAARRPAAPAQRGRATANEHFDNF